MKEQFKKVNIQGAININLNERGYWRAEKKQLMAQMISIAEDYQEQGFTLTLRQLYYQLVAKDYIPNHDKVYKKLSSIKDEAVYSGLIDWDIFEDRGRVPHTVYYEDGVKEALDYTARAYRIDRQQDQNVHVEVWTEKDAISSILKKVTNEYGITLVVNKGYTSSTAMYGAYKRFVEMMNEGKKIKILYFGDHDPSGLDMVRDIDERLKFMFANGSRKDEETISKWTDDIDEDGGYSDTCRQYMYDEDCRIIAYDGESYFDPDKAFFKHHFSIEQIGLTMDQIREFNPPENPAKITDPRAGEYIKKFGRRSWEVDALKPETMMRIVRSSINESIDLEIYNSVIEKEASERALIKNLIKDIE